LRRPGDLLRLAWIFGFAVAVPLLMRLRLPRLEAVLEPRRAVAPPDSACVAKLLGDVELVLARGRPLVRGGCLTRGITRYYFLRRAGLAVELCFGIGTVDDALVGHCWLVKDDEPYLETDDPRPVFREIYRIPPRPAAGRFPP
jgi:hypothetical protein